MPRTTESPAQSGNTVNIAVRVPRRVQDRLKSLADQVGLSQSDVLRLLLNDIPDDMIPPSLVQAAEAIRIARGMS